MINIIYITLIPNFIINNNNNPNNLNQVNNENLLKSSKDVEIDVQYFIQYNIPHNLNYQSMEYEEENINLKNDPDPDEKIQKLFEKLLERDFQYKSSITIVHEKELDFPLLFLANADFNIITRIFDKFDILIEKIKILDFTELINYSFPNNKIQNFLIMFLMKKRKINIYP